MIRAHSEVARGLTIRVQPIAFAIVTLAYHSRLEIIYMRQIFICLLLYCVRDYVTFYDFVELDYEIYYRLVLYCA